jgi:predicted PhzF superfamily epimerase YddE/YHI9
MRAFLVDAFVRPGAPPPTGNCAGVVLVEGGGLDAAARLAVAAELGQTETAFVDALPSSAGVRRLTWCTPTTEVPLCGHATLAAAAALVDAGGVEAGDGSPFRFATPVSGELVVHHDRGLFELDLPARPPGDAAPACVEALSRALVGEAGVASVSYNAALQYVIVVLAATGAAGRAVLTALAPEPATLLAAAPDRVSGAVATTLDGSVMLSRFWGPWMGIDEVGAAVEARGERGLRPARADPSAHSQDPVTGSAHTVLGPLWAPTLAPGSESDTPRLAAEQLSPRGGELTVRVQGGRVLVGGRGRIALRGELSLV